ncbi:MAG: Hsp20/alpha crystallin family protein [Saprospiraceae bacterium]|nr:Hsp20/alpha crystallin family protein [Saprospiraceae bacterium]
MANITKFYPATATKPFFGGLFDEFFNQNLINFVGADTVVNQPAVNVLETPDAFRLEIAAPGFDKQDFTVNVENDRLTVSGKRETSTEDKQEKFMRREFHFTSFQRSFNLPDSVNQNEVVAVYNNGVLHVTLPKKAESKAVTKTIAIE